MKCELCSEPASAHFCELLPDGSSTERHLCDFHARELLPTLPTVEQQALAIVPNLRALVTFIRMNNRMPTRTEADKLSASGDWSDILSGTAEFDQKVVYLENLIEFVETNRRFPTEEELPGE